MTTLGTLIMAGAACISQGSLAVSQRTALQGVAPNRMLASRAPPWRGVATSLIPVLHPPQRQPRERPPLIGAASAECPLQITPYLVKS
jgi:hypothetical protein